MKITASLIVLSIALTSYSSVSVPAKDEPEREKAEETYLVIYRPGPAWLEGKKRVAVTAGASTPSQLTREVIRYIEQYQPATQQ